MTRKAAKPKEPARALDAADLEAMSKAELADAYGPIQEALKPLEKLKALFKEEFERRGGTLFAGKTWSVLRSDSGFWGIDIEAAKAELGASWCAKHKKRQARVTFTAAPLNEADAAPEGKTEAA